MKTTFKRICAMFALIMVLCASAVSGFTASAASADLDTSRKVSFTASCDMQGFVFSVYKLADLEKTENPFGVKYTAAIDSLQDEIDAGVSEKKEGTLTAEGCEAAKAGNAILSAADDLTKAQLTPYLKGTYSVTADGAQKTFSDLEQGIYYVKVTQYPAGVKNTTNSVFALPYYVNSTSSWKYEISEIPLAMKVSSNTPGITKKIVENGNLEDHTTASVGDEIEFRIEARVTGSDQHTLSSFVIKDTAEKGIALPSSVTVQYFRDGETEAMKTLTANEYLYTYTSKAGETNTGRISIKGSLLTSGSDIYDADYVRVTLIGTLTEYALTTDAGNDNTSEYSWAISGGNVSKADSEETKVYTNALEIVKENESGTKLEGAHFSLYSDAQCTTEIATGISDAQGKVTFKNADSKIMLLKEGTYYVKETQSPEGYSRYTDVIEVVITGTYKDTFSSGTWINERSATAAGKAVSMTDGVISFTVTNTKVILPQTGGQGSAAIYITAGFVFIAGLFALVAAKKKSKA